MANVLDLDIGSSGLEHDDHLSVLCRGCPEAGSDRGWPERGATPAPKRPFNRRPGSARPLRRFCLLALLLVLVPWFLSRSLCHRLRSSHRPFLSDGLAGRPKNKRPREWARGLICAGAAGVRPARGPLSSSSQSAWADLGEVEEREESVPARRGAHSVSASLPSEVATVKHFLGACHGAACGTGGSDGRGSSRAAGRTQSRSPERRWCRCTSARPREPRNRTRSTCPGSARASRRRRRARGASG